jgi:GNAT superfamily N-acetyltransferase
MRTILIDGNAIVLRPTGLEEIIDLRHAVLRQGLPREAAIFEGDDAPSSRHFGAFSGDTLVGCATLHASQWEGEAAWQLRGMATLPEFRGKGIGRAVLEAMEADLTAAARAGRPPSLWCNARVPAVGF